MVLLFFLFIIKHYCEAAESQMKMPLLEIFINWPKENYSKLVRNDFAEFFFYPVNPERSFSSVSSVRF